MSSARTLTFTTAHWVIDWIHGHAANMGPDTFPAITPGFAEFLTLVFAVADLTDTGATEVIELSYFPRWQTDQDITAFFRHKLCSGTGTPNQLRAFAYLHFNVMNDSTERDIDER